jgi:hypothetical protein
VVVAVKFLQELLEVAVLVVEVLVLGFLVQLILAVAVVEEVLELLVEMVVQAWLY